MLEWGVDESNRPLVGMICGSFADQAHGHLTQQICRSDCAGWVRPCKATPEPMQHWAARALTAKNLTEVLWVEAGSGKPLKI